MNLIDRLGTAFTFDRDGCWRWTRALQSTGYTLIRAHGRYRLAHRVMYELVVGPIPAGLQLDHLCGVRHCVNPSHLEPVTARENTLRSNAAPAWNARKTRCARGHLYDKTNTYWHRDKRSCKACKIITQRVRRGQA